jgi:purine-binding chemotaxis protein CheW
MTTERDEPVDEIAILLARRAAALAQRRSTPAAASQRAMIVVTTGRERFALPAAAVSEVFAARHVAPLPWAPLHVAGLISRRGRIVPAFHLHAVLGLTLAALPERGRALVLGRGADAVALLVEAVDVDTTVESASLAPLDPAASPALHAVADGVAADGTVVLAEDRLLASPALVVDIPVPRTS